MKLTRNCWNGGVFIVAATCLFGMDVAKASPAAAPAAARSAAAPAQAPAANSPARSAPAETARPSEAVRPAEPSEPGVKPSPMPHGRHDGQRNPSNGAGSYSYPLGYAYNYWDPNWNAYNNYNSTAYPGQFTQPDTAIAEPEHTPPDAVIPAPTPSPSPADADSSGVSTAVMASPQWRDADAQVRIAQAAYDAASARVIDQLQTQPQYQQAVARKDQDAKRVDQLKAKDPAPPIDRAAPAATAKLDAAKSVTDLQNAALLADPAASAAKIKLDTAIARREEARQAVEANLPKSTATPAR